MSCEKIWIEYVHDEDQSHGVFRVPCGSWGCPDCQKRNAARFRGKLQRALKAWCDSVGYDPAKFRYAAKFVTLTCPGAEWRAGHTPQEAEEIIKAGWRKLRNRLKRLYPGLEFVQVDELQPSGFPHLHVLLLGQSIAGKGVLDEIRSFWSGKLGLGNIDVQVVKDLAGAGRYLSKYMSKTKMGITRKGYRVYTFSAGLSALSKTAEQRRRQSVTVLRVGRVNSDGSLGEPFKNWAEVQDYYDSAEYRIEQLALDELIRFFDEKRKGVQGLLWEG